MSMLLWNHEMTPFETPFENSGDRGWTRSVHEYINSDPWTRADIAAPVDLPRVQ